MQIAPAHFVVIPTHNRHVELAALLDSIPARAFVLVIDNASEPPVALPSGFLSAEFDRLLGRRISAVRDSEQPPNLSRLWNIGLDWAAALNESTRFDQYFVTVLNDDAVMHPRYFEAAEHAFRFTNAAIVFPNRPGRAIKERGHMLHREQPRSPVDFSARLTGWCFTLRGSVGLRADESMRWWCGDNDLEQQAMNHGGTVMLQDVEVDNLYADLSTVTNPALQAQTRKDMATFVEKWGFRPW